MPGARAARFGHKQHAGCEHNLPVLVGGHPSVPRGGPQLLGWGQGEFEKFSEEKCLDWVFLDNHKFRPEKWEKGIHRRTRVAWSDLGSVGPTSSIYLCSAGDKDRHATRLVAGLSVRAQPVSAGHTVQGQ